VTDRTDRHLPDHVPGATSQGLTDP
jgi:hypothetical protein